LPQSQINEHLVMIVPAARDLRDRAGNHSGLAQYWYYSDLETPSSLDRMHNQ
jgi:hypothetical protein